MMFLNIKPIPYGPELGIRPCDNTSPSEEQYNFIKNYFETKMNTKTTDSGLDLPLPYDVTVPAKTIGFKIPLGISAQPVFEDGKIKIIISNSKAQFIFPNSTLTTKLIDGSFPDYQRVIPKENLKFKDLITTLINKTTP